MISVSRQPGHAYGEIRELTCRIYAIVQRVGVQAQVPVLR